MVVFVVFGVAACDGPYLPPGWKAPIVESVVVAPAPVVAGQPFTVTVRASDDKHVKSISLYFLGPHPDRWDHMNVPCQNSPITPQPVVTTEFDCTMPAIAPNGDWTMAVTACDGEVECQEYGGLGGGGYATTTFGVTGGTDDDQPPALVSADFSPENLTVGVPFSVTLTISDDHLVPNLPQQVIEIGPIAVSGKTYYCDETSRAQPSGTEDQFTFACPAVSVVADYRFDYGIADQIGNFYLWEPAVPIAAAS
jgi:hypothetical protein